jgi:hypothetical protein
MELLEGEDLAGMLLREQRLGLQEAADVIAQLARGLRCVHEAGLVHGDLSPRHIFIIHEGDGGMFVKLLDFGAAERTTCDEPANQTDDALQFQSPEQLAGRTIDAHADVWSLAALAYRLLTGTGPFNGSSQSEIRDKIAHGAFAAAHALRPALPRELHAYFTRSFQSQPRRRYATVREASAALTSIAAAHHSGVRRRMELSPTQPARLPVAVGVSTRKAVRWAVVTALVGLLLGVWVMLRPHGEQRTLRGPAVTPTQPARLPPPDPPAALPPAAAAPLAADGDRAPAQLSPTSAPRKPRRAEAERKTQPAAAAQTSKDWGF